MTVALTLRDSDALGTRQRAPSKYFWTTREEKLLRELYPDGGAAACAPHLPGRSISAIYARANHIGLKCRKPRDKHVFRRRRWTADDHIDAAIRRVYQGEPHRNMVSELAARLGRPRWWISKRAQQLGLIAPRFKEAEWTDAECEIVDRLAHKSPKAIRAALRRAGFERTETAIVMKRRRLDCDTEDPNHMTAGGLAALMGVDPKTVTRWIDHGWLKANRRGTARSAAQGGDMWWIKRRAVRRFVIENAAMVDLRKVDKFWFIDLMAER